MIRAIGRLTDLNNTEKIIVERLRKASKETAYGRVGFVSGALSSSKPLYIIRNFRMLNSYTKIVRKNVDFPVFSAIDFFGRTILIKLTYQKEDNQELWNKILQSGYITDLFMAPGWKESSGAVSEHKTAKKSGIKIRYIASNPVTSNTKAETEGQARIDFLPKTLVSGEGLIQSILRSSSGITLDLSKWLKLLYYNTSLEFSLLSIFLNKLYNLLA